MQKYEIGKYKCRCGTDIETARSPDTEKAPVCGNLCLCVMCGALYQFDETMRLIEVTPQKFAELPKKVQLEVIFFRQRSAMIMASILSNPSEPPN